MVALQRTYSHIYIENSVWEAEDAIALRKRFKNTQFVKIDSYKELFNRSKQNWREQKLTPKLILAHRESNFLYPCSDIAPSFDQKNFYYTTPAINCMYDCSYCYLQGLYSSAYAVCFLNHGDFFKAVEARLQELGSLYLCISYDTDLLAFEDVIPYCRKWIEFARDKPNLVIEARSKSGNFRALQDIEPTKNVILAWTLSPESIQQKYEAKTPRLKARVQAVNAALESGWRVRLCFDPMIWNPESTNPYPNFLLDLQNRIDFSRLSDVYFGSFRMSEEYLKRIQRQRSDTDVLYQVFDRENNVAAYPPEIRQQLKQSVQSALDNCALPAERIFYHHI